MSKSIEGDVAPLPPQSDADEMIDQLNVVCEDFGCEAGSDRLFWLHDQLSELSRLRTENEAMREALRECEEWFDQRADADTPYGASSPYPNEEMKMLIAVREALSHGGNDNVG